MAKARRTAGDETPCPQTKQRSEAKSAGGHPQHDPDTGAQRSALALSIGLPGTRLDMVLGGPQPLLVQLARAMARAAAQADHTAELAQTTDGPACRTED